MTSVTKTRRRPAVQITDARAARLHRLIQLLTERPRPREELLELLQIGLRTFYRELELLRRCGVKVRQAQGSYRLQGSIEQAELRLPFPDPRLSFAEMRELAQGTSPAAQRLAALLESVLARAHPTPPEPPPPSQPKRKRRTSTKGGQSAEEPEPRAKSKNSGRGRTSKPSTSSGQGKTTSRGRRSS